jgi:hypothetical protein
MWISKAALVASFALSAGHAAAEPPPAHYDISARIVPATGTLIADVKVTLPPAETHDGTSFLIGSQYTVDSVTVRPHATLHTETVDEPFKDLKKVVVSFDAPPTRPVELRFKYHGPLNAGGENSDILISPELIELAIDSMWLPVRSGFNLRFTGDADIRGIPASMVAVAQGKYSHVGDRVRIHRNWLDFDLPLVATPGLQRVVSDDVEFFARDMDDALVQSYRKHALAAAAFHQKAFGPLPGGPIRMVVVPREREVGYARRGYTVVSEARKPGAPTPEFNDRSTAKYVAHEFAHAWWSSGDPLSENYWLSESMAEYASLRYIEATFGVADREAMLERKRTVIKDAGPILGGKRPSRNALYQKGPILLFELEQRIGRQTMDALLARLAPHPPDTTAEFLEALRAAAGADAAKEFEAKLRAP